MAFGHGHPLVLYINSLRPSVCDHWTQRKVTVKRKGDGGRREKWREKDKTTLGWKAFEVLKPRSWEPNTEGLKPRSWDPGPETSRWGPESQVLKPRIEGLKPRSWDPGPESSRWEPETQVLRSRSWNLALRSWNPGPESVHALLIGWSN